MLSPFYCSPRLALAAACISASVMVSNTFASTILADGLAPGKQRSVGDPIDGAPIQQGKGAWQASPNIVFSGTAGGGGASNTTATVFFARVPLPAAKRQLEVSAEIRPGELASNKDGWVALGFGANPEDFKFTWRTGAFVLITPDGKYQVIANHQPAGTPGTIGLPKGEVGGFAAGRLIKVKLSYDVAANSLSVSLNGVTVVDRFDFSSRGFHPDLSVAGFSGFSQRDMTFLAKNFQVVAD